MLAAVLRHQQQAGRDGVARVADAQRLAVEPHLAAGDAAQAEQRLGQFGAARADQAGHADDLAAAHGERDRRRRAAGEGQAAHLQPHRARRPPACGGAW